MRPIRIIPSVHPKAWGSERWCCNNDEFCGKILTLNKGAQFSMHFHRDKREVFYMLEGNAGLMTIDRDTAQKYMTCLAPGDCVEIPRLVPHQIRAETDCRIIEFSTHHEDSDSYRVSPGDSQK